MEKAPARKPQNLVPRNEAATVLAQVLSEGQALDEALRKAAEKIDPATRAWLWDVCSGVLRFKPRLDAAIDALALKKKPSGRVRRFLLVAAYQIFFQETVTPEKVVDETVEAIKNREGIPPANFANALLRKLLPQREQWKNLQRPAPAVKGEKLSAYTGLPLWFQDRVEKQRGRDYLMAFAEATQSRPQTWVHATQGAQLDTTFFREGPLAGAAALSFSPGIENLPGFKEGRFFVQDLSSQLAIQDVLSRVKGKTALDLCAAPGGKSFHLADQGWQVVATDISDKRLERVRENQARLNLPVETRSFNSVTASDDRYDLVWVDAPCTGSGIIRRHPDVKFLRDERQIAELRATQEKLLNEALRFVKPGGTLVYSVCSIFEEEGAGLAKEFAGKNSVRLERDVLISPQDVNGPDGFYYAIFTSSSES